jgi:hypothetical protein
MSNWITFKQVNLEHIVECDCGWSAKSFDFEGAKLWVQTHNTVHASSNSKAAIANGINFPIELSVPTLFYADHVERECGQTGTVVTSTKTKTTVLLDEEAFIDLYDDAMYYWNNIDDMKDEESKKFCRSAAAIVRMCEKVSS